MTQAILFALNSAAGSEEPAALLRVAGRPVGGRLIRQLRSLGVAGIVVLTRPEWRPRLELELGVDVAVAPDLGTTATMLRSAALTGEDDLLLLHADLVTHAAALRTLIEDPRITTGAVVSEQPVPAPTFRVRSARHRVVAAESTYHSIAGGEAHFLGVLRLGGRDRRQLVKVVDAITAATGGGLPAGWAETRELHDERWRAQGRPGVDEDPLSLVLVGLVRHDVRVSAVPIRRYPWHRPWSGQDADRATASLSSVEEEEIRLDAAVKADDGFFTTFFVSPYSKFVARWAARRGWTPNQVTVLSLLVAVASMLAFARGTQPAMIAGAILLQVSFVLDCVDGQLARYAFAFSDLGGWLDGVLDRVKEYLVYAGLAVGSGSEVVWVLACLALTIQVVRHQVDFGYEAQHDTAMTARVALPIERPDEPPVTALEGATPNREEERPARSVVRAANWAGQSRILRWAKRVVPLPIGERFALISLTAVLAGPRATFAALIIWGLIALAYVTTGRLARSLA